MTFVTVRHCLNERGTVTSASSFHRRENRRIDSFDIVPVNHDRLEPVGRRSIRRGPRNCSDVANRRELHIEVVLTDEEDGQLPHGGQIQSLVERADIGRPVAKEAGGDAVLALEL